MITTCDLSNLNYKDRIDFEIFYVCKFDLTIREIAALIHLSKTTVHRDLTNRLELYSHSNYLKVKKVLDEHKETRHLKGGEATRQKFLNTK